MTDTAPPRSAHPEAHVDVVIVGAGMSGIGAAYRLEHERPETSYTILEARAALGGTWDLFCYPGVRSDSDMYTLGYSFKPWPGGKALADGSTILDYIRETASESGVDRRVEFHSTVVAADFDTSSARWSLRIRDSRSGDERTMTCGFLYSCAGYYDYEHPHDPGLVGVERFTGQVVHPQFWPRDVDLAGKRVVVVGSGATAVTLVPALLRGEGAAEHVTMLQRSPTWISPVPGLDKRADRIRALLPERLAYRVIRAKNIAFSVGFYEFCRRRPKAARRMLTGLSTKILGDPDLVAAHFTPTYNPWDQRLCAVPDADLFTAIRSGRASVVTDHVDRLVPDGVRLTSGEVLEADIVVTATGLRLRAFGGIEPHVNGERVELSEQFVWQGSMVTGVPNFAVCIGYTNNAWTLRADLTHRLVCRVLAWMERRGHAAVVPVPDTELTPRPLLDLASGYVQRSIAAFPRQGARSPWRVRQNYLLDALTTPRARLDRTLHPVTATVPTGEASRRSAEAETPTRVSA